MIDPDQPKASVWEEIDRQLAWRSPSGKPQGRIVLSREHAAQLQNVPKMITEKIDELYAQLLRATKEWEEMNDTTKP
jgi:hypothetical protein